MEILLKGCFMKCTLVLFSIAALLIPNSLAHSQRIDSLYEVGTWQGFRSGAVTFTFDDGTGNQTTVALPLFDSFGFKMTFYPVINWGPNWSALQAAAVNDHEIGSHTVSHASFGTISTDSQNTELRSSQITINSHISAQKCLTVAYPSCVVGDTSVCSRYYIAARGCSGVVEPSTPANFMNISSFVCGNLGINTVHDFNAKIESAASTKGWVVFLIHAIDGELGYSPTSSDTLREVLAYLDAHRDKYWESTFVNVARYIKERNTVSVHESPFVDSTIVVNVTETLNDSIYNYPVTIRRHLPQNWQGAIAAQNGLPIPDSIVEVDSVKYIMFDAVPNGGPVSILKRNVTGVGASYSSLPASFVLSQNYPNPFNPTTVIEYQIPKSSQVVLNVYDILGRKVATLVDGRQSAGYYSVAFNAANLPSGVYFYELSAGGKTYSKKMELLK
jgi:hypothetical protein